MSNDAKSFIVYTDSPSVGLTVRGVCVVLRRAAINCNKKKLQVLSKTMKIAEDFTAHCENTNMEV